MRRPSHEYLANSVERVKQSPLHPSHQQILVVVTHIRRMQLDDNIVGSLLQAKETNQKPSADHAKCQGLEYRRLYQQWDQLVAQEGVLWRYYAQPREQLGWLQLVLPRNLRPSILEELHQGVGSGHLGLDKTSS